LTKRKNTQSDFLNEPTKRKKKRKKDNVKLSLAKNKKDDLAPIKSISLFDNPDPGQNNGSNGKFFDNQNDIKEKFKKNEIIETFNTKELPSCPKAPEFKIDILTNVKSTKEIRRKEYLVTNALFTLSCGLFYEGNLEFGKMHGHGILMLNPVNTSNRHSQDVKQNLLYDGLFQENQVNGRGILYFRNGEKYIGNFAKGKAHGNGILFDMDDKIISKGIWLEGKYYS